MAIKGIIVIFAAIFLAGFATAAPKKPCLQVYCVRNPCDGASCPRYPWAKCVPNYCGGCNADFYLGRTKVNCKDNCAGRMLCMIHCKYGNEVDAEGCPICKCKPAPIKPPVKICPPVCMIACKYGNVMKNGCPTCACKPAPWW